MFAKSLDKVLAKFHAVLDDLEDLHEAHTAAEEGHDIVMDYHKGEIEALALKKQVLAAEKARALEISGNIKKLLSL